MKRYSSNKDIHMLAKRMVAIGWRFENCKKHGVLIAPEGKKVVIPSTPSDRRAFYNFRSIIKSANMNLEIH